MSEELKNLAMEANEEAVFTERKRWLFLGLPWTFTKYIIKPSLLTMQAGLLKTEENDCYMYRIQDVKLVTTSPNYLIPLPYSLSSFTYIPISCSAYSHFTQCSLLLWILYSTFISIAINFRTISIHAFFPCK